MSEISKSTREQVNIAIMYVHDVYLRQPTHLVTEISTVGRNLAQTDRTW